MKISDLGIELSGSPPAAMVSEREEQVARANRFALSVPPFGILPMTVEGLNLVERREKQIAALSAEKMKENVMNAAVSELPGFNFDESFEEVWS